MVEGCESDVRPTKAVGCKFGAESGAGDARFFNFPQGGGGKGEGGRENQELFQNE